MTPELNHVLALQRIDDQHRIAERARLARLAGQREARQHRRLSLRLAGRIHRPIAKAGTP
jgi:hypothetical protein